LLLLVLLSSAEEEENAQADSNQNEGNDTNNYASNGPSAESVVFRGSV
jgi:hypothetical protein